MTIVFLSSDNLGLIITFNFGKSHFHIFYLILSWIFLACDVDYFCSNKFYDVFGLMSILAFLFRRKGSSNPTVGKDEYSRRRRRKTIKRELARLAKQLTAVNSTGRLARTCIWLSHYIRELSSHVSEQRGSDHVTDIPKMFQVTISI